MVITRIASAATSAGAVSCLIAVVMIPVPIGLVRNSLSPIFAPAFVSTLLGLTTPITHMPVLGLGIIYGVTSRDDHARGGGLIRPTSQYLLELIERTRARGIRHQIQGEHGPCAHRVDVREGVGNGNPAELVGIVHDRREEVHRKHNSNIVRDAIDRGVVGCRKAHEHIGISY